jgi:redox-sensitive bicupin YhaK (pirin superfamily)
MTATDPTDPLPPGLETVLLPRTHDIGGFEVRRALPAQQRQMVGPFIFFDQMGPGEFLTGKGVDVRPHPHIGLSTVTYLFEGEILHRDSLGTEQPIAPGDVNWMTAGRGISHSERTASPAPRRAAPPVRHPVLGRPAQAPGGDGARLRPPPRRDPAGAG